MEIRKLKTPLNLKLTFAVLALTAATLGSYVWLAVNLFKEDKIAYVFEAVEGQNRQTARVLESKFKQLNTFHEIFRQIGYHNAATDQIFNQNPDITAYVELNKKDKKWLRLFNPNSELLQMLNNNWNEISEKLSSLDSLSRNQNQPRYQKMEIENQGFLIDTKRAADKDSFLIIPLMTILNLLPESKLYQFDIFLDNNELVGTSLNLPKPAKEFGFQTKVLSGSIVSFRPYLENIVFMTHIDYSTAVDAATSLTNKSVYFGILVAGFIILSILFLAKRITAPLKSLYQASLELSQANFDHRVDIKENDEVGVLGDSFNFMASEIQKYLVEMKEKSRMEIELQTAQLVQQSFFPSSLKQGQNFKLEAFYEPAAECSGDWWGHLSTNDTEIFVILDVTGHGTAAALVTAMMHNTLIGISELGESNPHFRRDPATILSFLNRSLCAINIKLNATAFVLIQEGSRLHYSNASHNPPLLLRKPSGMTEISKQDILPLNESSGLRLGESFSSTYESISLDWKNGDQIILYTDGIVEATNSTGKAYGNRKFMKSLLDEFNAHQTIQVNPIISKFRRFLEENSPDDDITFLSLQFKNMKIFTTFEEPVELGVSMEKVEKSQDATVVIYDDLISKALASIEINENLQAIVNKKEVNKRQQPFKPKKIEFTNHKELHFVHQSIKELSEEIDSALSLIVQNDSFSEMTRYLKQTAIELVQNALIYQRSKDISQAVSLIVGQDEHHYIIQVTDKNGALEPTLVLDKAKKAFKEKTYEMKESGAGLGTSMIILGSDEVSIKVKKDEYTQIRCIISKYKRLKEFKLKNNAIYITKG